MNGMKGQDRWIWLSGERYPQFQGSRYDSHGKEKNAVYGAAEFEKTYAFDRAIESIWLRFSGDTEFQLFLNGELLATGPAAVGGDFLGNGKPREWFYAWETECRPEGKELHFFARVKLGPVLECEYSKGHGGFMLRGEVRFGDGTSLSIGTDESWLARKNGAYSQPLLYDGRTSPDAWHFAALTEDIWHAEKAPIPFREEKEIKAGEICLGPGERIETEFPLDMIYAGFLHMKAEGQGSVSASVCFRELSENAGDEEKVILSGDQEYRGFYLHSAGNLFVKAENPSADPVRLQLGFITTCYPVSKEAITQTDDEEMNGVLSVCRHTLRYCRQTHHLDSPRHCEPLACTGDYYIESLMTPFSFGDMRLAEFDILRTAELLRHQEGRIFHTTYSLIWVRMLWDVYRLSGNRDMLKACKDALSLLLARFETYLGENDLIENPPDYMFVDWIYIDEISLHHPPKCLGQTVLNMFYYMALSDAARIYEALSEQAEADRCLKKAEKLQQAVNSLLYDGEKGIYFEGLNTKTDEKQLYKWLPANTEKRYYLKHSNILAAYTGICGRKKAKELLHRIMADEIPGDVQPYFMHFLLEAIYVNGLREKYTRSVLEKWKAPVAACKKGLVEGFIPPEPTYAFDHSHAWGGTPLWSLPRALLGLEIEKAGCGEISLSPSLLGLKRASVEFFTPLGKVICRMEEGKAPEITAPKGVMITIRGKNEKSSSETIE